MGLHFDKNWSLFLDRDGVINTKVDGDYIRKWDEFKFIPGVLEALKILGAIFSTIVVTTNQQGIGKGFYTENDLELIHQKMLEQIKLNSGRIDKVYFCPSLAIENSPCRKPNTGMALQAKKDFPAIDFSKSVMVGDSVSDMQFGKNLGMATIYIGEQLPDNKAHQLLINDRHSSLLQFSQSIS